MTIEINQISVYVIWLFLLVITLYEILMYLRGKSTLSWKPYLACIENLGVKVSEDEDGHEQSRPFIHYHYKINRIVYKGKKIIYGNIWNSNYGDSCDDIVGLKVGSEVTVYVNPKNFNMSVMKPGYRGNFILLMGFHLAAFALLALFNNLK